MSNAEIIEAEVVDEEPTQAVALFDARPVMTPDVAAKQAAYKREVLQAALVERTDYMTIPGTPKPTLLKPGAEALLQFFGFGHTLERTETERDDQGKPHGFAYRCIVTKPFGDRDVVVASCEGYASRDEGKWAKAPTNTIMKMAQKRALVGAALQATGTSGLLTQDLDDGGVVDLPPDFGPIASLLANKAGELNDDQKAAWKELLPRKRFEHMSAAELVDAAVALGQIVGGGGRVTAAPSPPADTDRGGEPAPPTTTLGDEPAPAAPRPLTEKQRGLLHARMAKKNLGLTSDERHAVYRYATDGRAEGMDDLSGADMDALLDALDALDSGQLRIENGAVVPT